MEDNRIIIILLCIIIAILVAGIIMISSFTAKEDTNLAIADKKLNVGDSLAVKLTDANGNSISNETVNIRLTDKDGTTIDENITTNSKGQAKFKMEEKGKYSAECKFDGSDKYASSSTAGNITVKKPVTKKVSEEKTSNSESSSMREEYKITPDGWDPKEHEVSRRSIGDGNERVNYDDGYFRVVDKDGNIITHGWGG